jgi:tetratricopeptide (TPR) repeat protein
MLSVENIPTNIALVLRRMNTVAFDEGAMAFLYTSYAAEAFIKTVALTFYAGLHRSSPEDAYRFGSRFVRADGLGEFEAAIREATTLPVVTFLPSQFSPLVAWVTKRRTKAEDEWFRDTVRHIETLFHYLPTDAPSRVQCERVADAITLLVRFRNKTKAHGALGQDFFLSVNASYRDALMSLIQTCPAFSWDWLYFRALSSGQKKGTTLAGLSPTPLEGESLKDVPGHAEGVHFRIEGSTESYFIGDLIRVNTECNRFQVINGFYNEAKRTAEFMDYGDGSTRNEDVATFARPPVKPPPSETQALINLDVQSNIFGNLPATPEGYVRRAGLEQQLKDRLLDENHVIITLHGRGGVGKTSLALAVAQSIGDSSTPRFEYMLWFSSRDIDLRSTGPSRVSPDIIGIGDAAASFGRLFGGTGSIAEFGEVLRRPQPHSDTGMLFIFDNFETVDDPAAFHEFLDTWAHLPNKVLITSRQRAFKADFPIEVRGMEFPEAEDLMRSLSRKLGIEGLVTDDVIERIFAYSEGHVYVIRVLIGELAKEGRYTPPRELMTRRSDIVESVFERSFNKLTDDGRNVFLLVSNWQSPVSELALLAILSQRGIDVEKGIDECDRMSLILTDSSAHRQPYYSAPKLAHSFGRKKLKGDPDSALLQQELEALHAFGNSDSALRASSARDTEMQRFIGWCNEEAAKRSHKIEYLNRLLESASSFWPKAWLELGKFRIRYGIAEGVAYALQRAVEEVPSSTAAWMERWRYAAQQGDGGTYVASLVGAAESAVDDPYLLSEIARELVSYLALHEEDIEPARRRIFVSSVRKRLETLADMLGAAGLARLGRLCLYEGDLDGAERYARRGLRLKGNVSECRDLLVEVDKARKGTTIVDRDLVRIGLREGLETRTQTRSEILQRLQDMVGRSASPVLMSKAGYELVAEFGPRLVESNWLGAGSFRQFLRTFPSLGFEVDPRHPGFLYDPARHELPAEVSSRAFSVDVKPEQEAMLRKAILPRLQRLVADSPRPVVMAHAASELIREFGPLLHESNWFHSGSFVQFLRTYPSLGFAVDTRIPGFLYDSDRADFSADLSVPEVALQVPFDRQQELRVQIRERLERMVADAPAPILMAQASDALIGEFGLILRESKWFGYGSFRAFIGTFPDLEVSIARMNGPDLLYDPRRHTVSEFWPAVSPIVAGVSPALKGIGREMSALIDELHRTMKSPRINPQQFSAVLDATTEVVNHHGFDLTPTGKLVRDLCVERGVPIARSAVQWILQCLMRSQILPTTELLDRGDLARSANQSIVRSALGAGLLLTSDDKDLVSAWVGANLVEQYAEH